MENTCNICSNNLKSLNYCITKNNTYFCYNCVQNTDIETYNLICKTVTKIVQNVPIIHLDKYNDDFSFYDYFLRIKND